MTRWTLPVSLVLLLACTVGCDSGDVSGGGGAGSADLSGDEFAVVGAEDAYANIDDATLTQEIAMQAAVTDGGGFRRHQRHPGHHGSHLGPVLRLLELDEAQRETIRAILTNHRAEVRPILELLREANEELIEQANAERRRIIESLRNAEITEEQARTMLRELSEATREAIRDNPANEPLLAELCAAKKRLFDDIRAVLDDDQRVTWDDWVSSLSGPCLGD